MTSDVFFFDGWNFWYFNILFDCQYLIQHSTMIYFLKFIPLKPSKISFQLICDTAHFTSFNPTTRLLKCIFYWSLFFVCWLVKHLWNRSFIILLWNNFFWHFLCFIYIFLLFSLLSPDVVFCYTLKTFFFFLFRYIFVFKFSGCIYCGIV